MLPKERNARRPAASTRERLTFVLVLLFIIVLLVSAFFPQSAAHDVLPSIAKMLVVAVRCYYHRRSQE
jgi:4-amino-4-deoxy-L-arabinose transferase-like glycosyltransferase